MKTPFLTFVVALSALASHPAPWRETGNGGDSVAQDFALKGAQAIERLRQNPNFIAVPWDKVELAARETQIVSEPTVYLTAPTGKSFERDAVNFPTKKVISVNRRRWLRAGFTDDEKRALALHEYLGIAGLERNHYALSMKMRESLVDTDKAVLIYDQVVQAPGQDGLTLKAAQSLCRRVQAINRSRFFLTYCTFETKQNVAIAPHTEYYKDYRFVGYSTEPDAGNGAVLMTPARDPSGGFSIGGHIGPIGARAGIGIGGGGIGAFFGIYRRSSPSYYVTYRQTGSSSFSSGGGGGSASGGSSTPEYKAVVVPKTVYETLDRSLYRVRVWGVGELKNIAPRMIESSLELDGGRLRHDFATADDALDSCYEALLTLQSDPQAFGRYERAECTTEKSGDRFYYVIRSQNPLLPQK